MELHPAIHQLIGISVFILFCYQVYGTYQLLITKAFNWPQKFLAFALIWILPLVGCLFVMHLIQSGNAGVTKRYFGQSSDEDRLNVHTMDSHQPPGDC